MLTSENFCAADLWAENLGKYIELDVQFVSIKKGEVVGNKGRKKGMPFVTMLSVRSGKPIPKPLGLNATNCKTIASLAGSDNVDKWIGPVFTLMTVDTNVDGVNVRAIRISNRLGTMPTGAPPTGPKSAAGDRSQDGSVDWQAPHREAVADAERHAAEVDARGKAFLDRQARGELTEEDQRAIEMAEAADAGR